MPHEHKHHHSHHGALSKVLVLTLAFAVVETIGGFWSGSLALLSDAGHMLSDSLALGLAAFASWIAHRPPSRRHSYGLARAEVIAALANSLLMLVLIVGIVVEAINRFLTPHSVSGPAVMVIAAIGLVVNIGAAVVLSHGGEDLNTRAALLHVFGDLLGSVAALIAGAVVYFTGWLPIDPLLSLVVSLLILFSSLRLLREALHVLMEGVPSGIRLEEVGQAMAQLEGINSIHDLHIWSLSSGKVALSAHAVIGDMNDWTRLLESMRSMLHDQFDINHITLQPEVIRMPHSEKFIEIHPK